MRENLDAIGQIINKSAKALQRAITEISALCEAVEKNGNLAEVSELWFVLKEGNDAWDELRKELYHAKDRLEKGVLPEMFEKESLDKISVPELGRSFYPQVKHNATVVDKDKAFAWLKEQGATSLIVETINASTLTAFVRDMVLEKGTEPPADVIKFNTYKQIGSSKYNPKSKK